ncbi:hypothetical protein JVU11DRAFT_8510 [Chiua virens]|nr:hypothetical protein JVU11DRAFT_8510 [Chiua virens]
MVNFTVLAGGFDAYITSYLFNTNTNTLTFLNQYSTGGSPSWINSHPTNKSILYAVNEKSPDGAVQSFTIGTEGSITLRDTFSSGGNSPTYCAGLSTGQVAVTNYVSGTARVIPTEGDPLYFSNDSSIWTFPVPITAFLPDYFIPFGVSLVHRVTTRSGDFGEVNGNPGNYAVHGEIQHPIGSGPRHIRIRDNMLYALHELIKHPHLYKRSPPTLTALLRFSQTFPSFHLIPPAGSSFAAAEILIPEPTAEYPTPFIYTSNRNTGVQDPRGDTIAIFENVNNTLVLRNQVYTGLDQIRGIMSGEQAGFGGEAYIVAAGFAGTAGVKVFRRTECGANLEEVAVNMVIPTRTSFIWLNQFQVGSLQ